MRTEFLLLVLLLLPIGSVLAADTPSLSSSTPFHGSNNYFSVNTSGDTSCGSVCYSYITVTRTGDLSLIQKLYNKE